LDARGAPIDQQQCRQLVDLLAVSGFSGDVDFRKAQFGGNADFRKAQFSGWVDFGEAQFGGNADFQEAQFSGKALFDWTQFSGEAEFREAQFSRDADFEDAKFSRFANFSKAQFSGEAEFREAQFGGLVAFGAAQFGGLVNFHKAQFGPDASFGQTQFGGDAYFDEAQFRRDASFGQAQFGGDAYFREAQFRRGANFDRVRFGRLCVLGPLRADTLHLSAAEFEGAVTLHAACSTIAADDVRARNSFTLTGRGCDITMTGARFDAPGRIASSPAQVAYPKPVREDDDKPPRLLSVEGADLSNLTMAGIDLSACRFVGAYDLDKLHIDGPPTFAHTPAGWRWTRRRTLAEEHRWRARYDRRPAGWYSDELRPPGDDLPEPDHSASKSGEARRDAERVSVAYRALRKSFEDAKNEPGAADFYYGEMEMRRLARRGDPRHRPENALLIAYWAVSGYGLRASRAFLALLLALAVATVVFATVGFGRSQQTVYVPIRSPIVSQPVAYRQMSVPDGKPGFREAAYHSVQSATSLLREPTSEPLTASGRISEIALRLLGPLLLGLAVLALRGRVKR
jgi:hypothetical protein